MEKIYSGCQKNRRPNMAEIKMDHKISGYECPECENDEIELG